MAKFPKREVKKALDHYISVRAKADKRGTGWGSLADLFTEDATFIDPAWGRFVGGGNIRRFMDESMTGLEKWSFPVDWIAIDGERAIIKFRNRLPGQRPDGTFYEAPGVQLLTYAGEGKFSFEEDIINMVHMMEVIKESGWVSGPEMKIPEKVVR